MIFESAAELAAAYANPEYKAKKKELAPLNLEFKILMDRWHNDRKYEKLAFLELVESLDQAGFPDTARDTITVMQGIEREIDDARIFGY